MSGTQAAASEPLATASALSWVERLVTVRQVGDLRVFRVAVGGIEVLSYPTQDRADQVAAGLRAAIAEDHEAVCVAPAVPAGPDGSHPHLVPARPPESLPDPLEALPWRILAALRGGPLSGRAVSGRLGSRWSAVFRELRALEAAGQVVREGRGRAARFRRA